MKQCGREEIMKGLGELVTEINYLEKADDIEGEVLKKLKEKFEEEK